MPGFANGNREFVESKPSLGGKSHDKLKSVCTWLPVVRPIIAYDRLYLKFIIKHKQKSVFFFGRIKP